jgi:hypothetical protein
MQADGRKNFRSFVDPRNALRPHPRLTRLDALGLTPYQPRLENRFRLIGGRGERRQEVRHIASQQGRALSGDLFCDIINC